MKEENLNESKAWQKRKMSEEKGKQKERQRRKRNGTGMRWETRKKMG